MRVMAAPMKQGQNIDRCAQIIKQNSPRLVGMTEMASDHHDWNPQMHQALGHSSWSYSTRTDSLLRGRECPLFRRISPVWRVLHRVNVPLSGAATNNVQGMGNARYAEVVDFKRWRKKITVITTHTNAGVQDILPPNPTYAMHGGDRLWKAERQMAAIEHAVLAAKRRGARAVIVIGDFNIMDKGMGSIVPYSPAQTFKRLRMEYVSERAIYIGYWGCTLTSMHLLHPGKGWPADHAAIVADLKLKW